MYSFGTIVDIARLVVLGARRSWLCPDPIATYPGLYTHSCDSTGDIELSRIPANGCQHHSQSAAGT